jgi:hypothetical protein
MVELGGDGDGPLVDELDEVAAINSEIRYLTLELMKLAAKEGKSFDQVTREYVQNTFNLYRVLTESQVPTPQRNAKRVRA